ncbi:hypothetical protein MSG28_005736 [Choristoneura fumiferana]|uniref:Uncharacterized protein n=1 Tax=Choristoneura fumiferana TaxID=7141 RepID=A0ACC0L0I8_CHOFU|nr:hypothetical protein MSG28_005736 [Choristoneura fumiferana]
MEQLPKGTFLKFKPNQLQEIRKLYDLDKPGRIDEAVDLLVDWIKKQDHFRIKEFHSFLEELSTEEHIEYMKFSQSASTDESKRTKDKFNENYIGMPGSFRTLSVD